MTSGFRRSMAPVHGWAGLYVGWVLYFMSVTGSAGYFTDELDRWMRPEAPLAVAEGSDEGSLLDLGVAVLRQVSPDAPHWYVEPPSGRRPVLTAWQWLPPADGQERGRYVARTVAPATGRLVETRDTGGGRLLYRMHYNLHYLAPDAAYWIVGVCSMAMALAIVTGVVVHRRIFRDLFTFRPGSGQRSWLTLHNALSVAVLPFHAMITYSGLVIMMLVYQSLVVSLSYGDDGLAGYHADTRHPEIAPARAGIAAPVAPPSAMLPAVEARWGAGRVFYVDVVHPGDAHARTVFVRHREGILAHDPPGLVFDGVGGGFLGVHDEEPGVAEAVFNAFTNLHEGRFAGPALRWLYFGSGLLGAGMIASGLVLWTVKRRERADREGRGPAAGLRLVERLNPGILVGLPIGIAAYFWANRLLPVDLPARAEWEAHALFAAWAAGIGLALLRPVLPAWRELCAAAAAAFALLPVLNALTTGRHLAVTLPHGDWSLAGVDLTFAALGLLFAVAAWRLAARCGTR